MELIQNLLRENMNLIYFIYGLVFFMLGFTILLKNRTNSDFRLANSLIFLAGFGILHGIYEWGYIFIPLQADSLSTSIINKMHILRLFMEAFSYVFLFYFGVHLFVKTKQKSRRLLTIPWILLLFWMILYAHFESELLTMNVNSCSSFGDIWARYLLALPGTIITCYALVLQKSELKALHKGKILNKLYGFIALMGLYGVVAGLIVPEGICFLSKYVNNDTFLATFNLPVQIFRTIIGLGMTYFLIGILEIYNLEYYHILEKLKKEKAVLKDRQRICRNLHDGIIQSIYGVGLGLEHISYLIEENPPKAKQRINDRISDLNSIIGELRKYIMDLKPKILKEGLFYELLKDILANFDSNDIEIHFEYNLSKETKLFPQPLDNIYHILQEGLNNIKKHSQANKLSLKVYENNGLIIKLTDNGIGFNQENINGKSGKQQGLKNIEERVKALDGEFILDSLKEEGTELIIKIPYEVIKNVCSKNNAS
ncbi:sensor histidine kinase [Selenihalanaerobacter shriftii]|uniref:histidine kinase n=1 Tax=Selenihalanaerobacter shriftii TaxID=142842 RepID=A0A1T4L2Z5_9FIRM|nr:sensor histidine kinase [Selenihalanaerobacter shriftii]SJZ48890.1 Signal transduction histidine kinase [Selenihalanaerobacter shriftii]